MDLNEQKQQFSVAVARAVAAVCGLAYNEPGTDDDSVDATLAKRGGSGTTRSPKLDMQLKCSAVLAPGLTHIPLSLPIKNYDELRPTNVMVPRILVVTLVPVELDDWLTCSEDQLVLRKCAYWLSLRGLPASENKEAVSVYIPRAQIFDAAGVQDIFKRLQASELP